MKNYFLSLVSYALLFTCSQSLSQNLNEPITVSPLIGDKLDLIEKQFFNLPPPIMGFKEAAFFLNLDSSVTAKVTYRLNETFRDTIIDRYLNLGSFQNYLITKTSEHIKYKQQSIMDFYLNDNRIITASLYRVNEISLSFLKPNIIDAINSGSLNEYMLELESEQVQKITIQKDVAVWPYALGGSLIGLIAGGVIGGSLVSNESDNFVEAVIAKPLEKTAAIAVGGLIGAAFGLIVGIVVGNNITTDIEFVAHPITGYSILQKRALLYSVSNDK